MSNASEPASNAVAVTLDASIPNTTRGLYVGAAGNVAVTMAAGQSVTFVGVQAGTVLPIRVSRVLSSGTTASNLLALY